MTWYDHNSLLCIAVVPNFCLCEYVDLRTGEHSLLLHRRFLFPPIPPDFRAYERHWSVWLTFDPWRTPCECTFVPPQDGCQDCVRTWARRKRERERECIKLLIYDSKLFYFFYANLRCVVQAARKQSDKGSNCFFEICLCFLSRFTTKFRSAAVKVFWLPRRRPVLEWSQWFFVECGIPSILRRHMIQVESSHKCVHIQSVDCSHGGATAIYNVHTPFFISLCRAGYC